MTVTKEMKDLVAHAFEKNDIDGAESVKIEFNPRLTSAFGRAHLRSNKIDISSKLWERATEEERKEVMIHEACHLVVFKKYEFTNRRPSAHGMEWRIAMLRAGVSPRRTHKINNKDLKRKVKRYGAKCDCKEEHWITTSKKNKINRCSSMFICRRCKRVLRLTGEVKYL